MKILIVSGFFYPEITPRAFRTTELVKELVRQGHSVTLYIPNTDFNYNSFQQEYPIEIKYMKRCWRRLSTRGSLSIINRVLNRIGDLLFNYPDIEFYKRVIEVLTKENETYDLLISIAVPHSIHWGVAKTLRKNTLLAKTWIADCGDPFMGCKTDSFKKMFYFKYLEKSFCSLADYISIPISSGMSGYYPEFHSKIRIIPQGFDFTKKQDFNFTPNKVVTFVYAGVFIPGVRDPRPILDVLSTIDEDFRFIVYTSSSGLISEYKDVLKNKLEINNYIPRDQLLDVLKRSDFLLNIENGTNIQSPSKLIDYALSDRPILSINSQNIDIDKLKSFLHRDYRNSLEIDNLEQYDIKNVVQQFLNLTINEY